MAYWHTLKMPADFYQTVSITAKNVIIATAVLFSLGYKSDIHMLFFSIMGFVQGGQEVTM
jgi:hypothetical protein